MFTNQLVASSLARGLFQCAVLHVGQGRLEVSVAKDAHSVSWILQKSHRCMNHTTSEKPGSRGEDHSEAVFQTV